MKRERRIALVYRVFCILPYKLVKNISYAKLKKIKTLIYSAIQ